MQDLDRPVACSEAGASEETTQVSSRRDQPEEVLLPRVWSSFPHVHHTSDAVAGVHVVEGVVDLVQRLTVGYELVHLELAIQIVLDKSGQLGAALDPAKGATAPDSL